MGNVQNKLSGRRRELSIERRRVWSRREVEGWTLYEGFFRKHINLHTHLERLYKDCNFLEKRRFAVTAVTQKETEIPMLIEGLHNFKKSTYYCTFFWTNPLYLLHFWLTEVWNSYPGSTFYISTNSLLRSAKNQRF